MHKQLHMTLELLGAREEELDDLKETMREQKEVFRMQLEAAIGQTAQGNRAWGPWGGASRPRPSLTRRQSATGRANEERGEGGRREEDNSSTTGEWRSTQAGGAVSEGTSRQARQAGTQRQSAQLPLTSCPLGLGLDLLVAGHASLELVLALGELHMLNAHMNALADHTTLNLLVHHNAEGPLGNVPHTASATVVVAVGHALVDSSVDLDVDIVAELVGGQVCGHAGKTLLAEGLLEHVARVAPNSPCLSAPHPASNHQDHVRECGVRDGQCYFDLFSVDHAFELSTNKI
eukprot:692844-Hanusia_phi.AAC.1